MSSRQVVRFLLAIPVGGVVTVMDGNQSQPMENLHSIGIIDDVHSLSYIFRGDAVVVLVQHYVAVTEHSGRLPALHLIADIRKRLEEILLHLVEQFTTRLPPSAQPAAVKRLQRLLDCNIQRRKIVEYQPLYINIDRAVH